MREYIVTEEDIRLLSGEFPSTKKQFARIWQLNNGEGLPEIVRGRDCERFDRCPMRKGDGSCFCWQGLPKPMRDGMTQRTEDA